MGRASWLNNFNNNSNFNANDRNINNNNRLRGIDQCAETISYYMTEARDLWQELCSYSNIQLAFKRARKHKTLKPYVLEFEADVESNLTLLRTELLFHSYQPKPLETFILRDPKTRKISKSHFRDRVIHHALCNVIEPLFEKTFIYDSYANRIGKGALKALERFEFFARKTSHNHSKTTFVFKADIRHYFETVDHTILLTILKKKIKDQRIIWLIKKILHNYSSKKGMPLGNLTSQFFANVYLNELDQFIKHQIKAKYYIRYVDDFVIIDRSKERLEEYEKKINHFVQHYLSLDLHPDKSKIILLQRGVEFLGFKIFPHHRLLKKRNQRKCKRKIKDIYSLFEKQEINFDSVYNFMEGWCAYAKHANTYNLRQQFLLEFEQKWPHKISSKEVNRLPKKLLLSFPNLHSSFTHYNHILSSISKPAHFRHKLR